MSTHQLTDGRKVKTKAGTQIINRDWRFMKERFKRKKKAKASCSLLSAHIRSAQYEYWHRKDDLWLSTGTLLKDYMSGFAKRLSN